MSEVTRILNASEEGSTNATNELLPLVYAKPRKLASQKMAHEQPEQALQATTPVHEATIRLVDLEAAWHWHSRGHFSAVANVALYDDGGSVRQPAAVSAKLS